MLACLLHFGPVQHQNLFAEEDDFLYQELLFRMRDLYLFSPPRFHDLFMTEGSRKYNLSFTLDIL